jgi:hypothetical protein
MGVRTYELPREKLQRIGLKGLSRRELIQLVIGSGTKRVRMEKLARRIDATLGRSYGTPTLADLMSVDGVGVARGMQLLAALELAYRTRRSSTNINAIRKQLIGGLKEGECGYVLFDASQRAIVSTTGRSTDAPALIKSAIRDIVTSSSVGILMSFRARDVQYPDTAVLKIHHSLQLFCEMFAIRIYGVYLADSGRWVRL